MKVIPPILTCLIVALWGSAIAILCVQNPAEYSLKFFGWNSMELTVGVILTFSFAVGVITTAILQPISDSLYSQKPKDRHQETSS
ncbi:MAG: DUF1049 domain-containing protein [Okeania sp. SIO2H7]|nr:DUF1049 domain-containing protein [Okeania sp. SIO2H7]